MNNDNNENIPERKNKQFMHIRDIIKCCDDALKINPNNTVTLYNMGKCFLEQENINYVYNIIEKIKNVDDKNSFVNILEGHIFLKKGCFVEAYRQFLQSFVNIKYNDVFLAYGIGILFEAMENFNLSKIWYKHILQTNIELFKFLEITFRLAVCFKKENKLVDALDCFYWLLNSIKINYFEHEVELQIAHVFERLNEIDKCLEIIDKLKLKNKNIILVNRLYCWVLYKTGCFQKFKDLFKCKKEVIVEKIRFDKNFDKDENEGDLYKQSSLDEIKGENKEFFKSMFKQFNKNEGDLYKQSSLDEIKSENKEFYNEIYKKFDKNSGDLYKQSSLDEIKSESKEFNNSIYKKIDKNKNNEFNNDIYKYNNKDIDKTAYREKLDNNNINNKEMIKEPTFYNNENKNMSFNEQINTQFIKKTFINNEFYDKFKKDNYFFKEEIMKDKIFFKDDKINQNKFINKEEFKKDKIYFKDDKINQDKFISKEEFKKDKIFFKDDKINQNKFINKEEFKKDKIYFKEDTTNNEIKTNQEKFICKEDQNTKKLYLSENINKNQNLLEEELNIDQKPKKQIFKNLYNELFVCDCSCKLEIKDLYIIYLLGRIYVKEENYEIALELFNICIKLDQNAFEVYNSIGVIYFKRNKYDTALTYFQKSFFIKGYNNIALENINKVESKIKNPCLQIKVKDVNPDIFNFKYLDNQAVFNNFSSYVNLRDYNLIHEIFPYKLKEFL